MADGVQVIQAMGLKQKPERTRASRSKNSAKMINAAVKSGKIWVKNCPLNFATMKLLVNFAGLASWSASG